MKNENKIILIAFDKFFVEKNLEKLNNIFTDLHSSVIYDHIHKWSVMDLIRLINYLNTENASNLFKLFSTSLHIDIIEKLSDEKIRNIFEHYYTDDAVDILEELPYKLIQKILNTLNIQDRLKINKIFTFAKHQAGFHMTIDYVYIYSNQSLRNARLQIKSQVKEFDTEIVGNIFVVDDKKRCVGYLSPTQFVIEANDKKVNEIMKKIDMVRVSDNIANAEDIMSNYDVSSVPVVDVSDILVGIIEAEDIIEKYEKIEESFLDSSIVKLSDKKYMEMSAVDIFKSRVWWIVALLFIGMITQIMIMGFQNIWSNSGAWNSTAGGVAVSSLVTLALSTSLSVTTSVNDAAGNSGSQTSTTMIRAFGTGEINESNYKKVIKKEMTVSLMVGFSVGVSAFVRMFLVWGIMGELNNMAFLGEELGESTMWIFGWYVLIAAISSFTFFFAIMIGNFLGAILPIWAHKKNIDGAIISGPVQTTIIDIASFAIYLTLTTIIFIPLVNHTDIFDKGQEFLNVFTLF